MNDLFVNWIDEEWINGIVAIIDEREEPSENQQKVKFVPKLPPSVELEEIDEEFDRDEDDPYNKPMSNIEKLNV